MSNAISIGASSETILSAQAAIVEILDNKNSENATKVAALQALSNVCQVSDVTIQRCNFEIAKED